MAEAEKEAMPQRGEHRKKTSTAENGRERGDKSWPKPKATSRNGRRKTRRQGGRQRDFGLNQLLVKIQFPTAGESHTFLNREERAIVETKICCWW